MNDVNITLSSDEALVYLKFFARFDNTDDFALKDNAEYLAFQKISAQLEKSLVEILKPNYSIVECRPGKSRVMKD